MTRRGVRLSVLSAAARRGAAVALLLLGAAAGAGCAGAEAQEPLIVGADDLPPSAGTENGIWQSSGWIEDPWQSYPGGRELILEHDLGTTPRSVLVYLAFTANGSGAGLAAGDLAQVRGVSETDVRVFNATAQDYFVRVVLQ